MSEGMVHEFETANEEGKLDMFGEALSNIHQLEGFLEGERLENKQLREALTRKDEEIAAWQNRLEAIVETDLLSAASALLTKIDNITTEQFRTGAERSEREELRRVIATIKGLELA